MTLLIQWSLVQVPRLSSEVHDTMSILHGIIEFEVEFWLISQVSDINNTHAILSVGCLF